ncbi:hypothetical protein MMC21_003865 [Puttea exsequens]|nr:hypothetical protein [Puttea exsequens]
MPTRAYGIGSAPRPTGIRRHQPSARHYYSNGRWHNPSAARESCYSDFVPCTYDEQTLIARLYKYARDFLAQTNGSILQRSPISNAKRRTGIHGFDATCDDDIEMIASSPSPTLHASTSSCSPRSYDGSFRFPTSSKSPRSYIKPPPPAAFPRQIPPSPSSNPTSNKRPLSSSSLSRSMVDVGTQYSPPTQPMPSAVDPSKTLGKRRGTSRSPSPPAEPPAEPKLPPKNVSVTPVPQAATASSTTLAQSSSSSSSRSQGSSLKRHRGAKPAMKYMPVQYETCDVKDLVSLISNMLLELIRFNDEIPLKDGRLTRFHSRAPPGIGVKDYLQRLTTHATLSPPILLSMVYYIDRLCALYPAFTISSLTVHRFLITAATVASKGLSDSFWTNNTYARVGGVSLKELALLELEFLWRVEWRIVPKPEVLVDYYRSLVERSEGFKIADDSKSGSSSSSISSDGEMDAMESKEGVEKSEEGSAGC